MSKSGVLALAGWARLPKQGGTSYPGTSSSHVAGADTGESLVAWQQALWHGVSRDRIGASQDVVLWGAAERFDDGGVDVGSREFL
jgi:hypothetical protein